jgi:RNA polymerase sigma-70 factor (ECF subfamily)
MYEDLNLIKSILKGNVDSFSILVNKYEMMVLKFVYNIVRDRGAAEDITQEVFITVYNKLYMYNSEYKFSNWLLQISRNKSIDFIRKYKKAYEENIEDIKELSTKEISPEQSAEYKETKSEIIKFINELTEIDRQILVLKYKQELTFTDLAQVLDMNESAIKRRYYRMREKFKEYLVQNEKGCK